MLSLQLTNASRRNARPLLALAAATVLATTATRPLVAQGGNQVARVTTITRDDGTVVPIPVPARGFSLFGSTDLAGTSLKLKGAYRWAQFNAGGLCSFANTAGDIVNSQCGAGSFFHYLVAWGAPLHEYFKIRAIWPGVQGMQQPVGYSTPWRITSIAPIVERIGPADDQYGSYFSGITALTGAGCRDMSGAQGAGLPASFVLTAASDCPETWGPRGFEGIRRVPDSVWLERFRASPIAFRWDDWKIPPPAMSGARALGDLATYGAFADFNREILARYGGITPRGRAGDPSIERGFPLGIEVRYDAFKFDRLSLREGVFVRWLVINSSEKVWGQGIDYDSLYMGVDPGYINSSRAVYNLPSRGLHLVAPGGLSGQCTNNTYPRRLLPGVNEGCPGGFANFDITIVLKSPIGDLRNKLFSEPTSPFYSPAHPKADDTITFNHWRKGGFGSQEQLSWRRSDRSLFGLFSGKEDLWLDGRSATDFSAGQIWNLFRYEFTDGTQSLANTRYNRSVPGAIAGFGSWDYNDDGVQDTLMVTTCGVSGCAALFSDTIPGGFSALAAGNMANFLGAGPFALRAGDTTEFMWFIGKVTDTLRFNALVGAATETYLSNFLDAQPIALPALTASDVQLTSAVLRDSLQNTAVRIQLKMPPRGNDAYIARALSRLESNETVAAELRRLNPGLLDTVRARMTQNLARVLVFKSCDRGKTWTDASGTCESAAGARTEGIDGATLGLGWQAFKILPANATGALSTNVINDAVMPGREYLYSLVSQSRGLSDIRVVISETIAVDGTVTSRVSGTLWDAMFIDVDTVTSTLASGGPTTVTVYAPVSLPAGTVAAHVDTATMQGLGTGRVAAVARSGAVSGSYRMRFGNRFVVIRTVDTVSGARTSAIIRQSVYRAFNGINPGANYSPAGVNGGAALSPGGPRLLSPGGGTSLDFVASADTFATNREFTYSARRNADGSIHATRAFAPDPKSIDGSVLTFIDTIDAAGYVLASGASGAEPFFLSVGNGTVAMNFTATGGNDSALVQNTDVFEGARWYPGFSATVANESLSPTPRLSTVLRDNGDTVRTASGDTAGVRYVAVAPLSNGAITLGVRGARGGTYRITWADDAFGPGAPFVLEPWFRMQPKFDASLAARRAGSVTDLDPALRAAIVAGLDGVAQNGANLGTRPLVSASAPFVVRGTGGQVVRLAMIQRHTTGDALDSLFQNSVLFGSAGDTTRIWVPPNAWRPGDTLWVFENVLVDSTATVGTAANVVIVRDTTINGVVQRLPIQVPRQLLTAKLVFRCPSNATPARSTCNPIRRGTLGATGYTPYANGWVSVLDFTRPLDRNSDIALSASPTVAGALPLTKRDMSRIHAVPNPFVVQSAYDRAQATGSFESRLLFVNVPKQGMIRIYTVSGQMVQQLSWTESDLVASGDGSPHGDLPYNLRTREGRDLAAGLYIYVLTARGAGANGQVARGKFVIIK